MTTAAALPDHQWQQEIPLHSLQETASLAHALALHLRRGDLLVLTGELGAGKTTFTQSLARRLSVQDPVSSPTFVLSRIHHSTGDGPDLVHVDLYRTGGQGVDSLDLAATLPHSVTVVEWGRGAVEYDLMGRDGSWIDLELLHGSQEAQSAATNRAPAFSGSEPAAPVIQTDFSETEEDLEGSPRIAVLRGYGQRWEHPPGWSGEFQQLCR